MTDQDKIKKIANSIDKLIHDFIPDLEGISISEDDKIKIVENTIEHITNNESGKQKLFITLPQPFLADWVCKHKEEIKKLVYKT